MSAPRLLIVGLDGATFDVLGPLCDAGRTPNLARLMERGVSAPLRSTIHPTTPMAWSSFLTGVNPGRHGIFDFTARVPGSYRLRYESGGSRRASTFLRWLSREGLSVGSIAVPFTWPPEDVNGYVLSGIDAPSEDRRACFPPEIYDEIRREVGAYHIYLASPVGRGAGRRRILRDMEVEDRNRTDVALLLRRRHPTDVSLVVYQNTDRAQHLFLGGSREGLAVVQDTYCRIDAEIGRLLAGVEDAASVLVLSDHGAGPISRVFRLNRWLEGQELLCRSGRRAIRRRLLGGARGLAKRLLPRAAKSLVKARLPGLRDRADAYLALSDVDWGRTRAYGLGMYGNVYANLRGREPLGIVEPGAEHEALLESVADRLLRLRDPARGERLVANVHRGAELFHGPFVDRAPDLLIEWKDYAVYTAVGTDPEEGDLFAEPGSFDASALPHVGTHRLDGILIAAGPAFGSGRLPAGQASILDLAPTILCALGLPIPSGLDGRVLTELLEAELAARGPSYREPDDAGPAGGTGYAAGEAHGVRQRLEGLGYL